MNVLRRDQQTGEATVLIRRQDMMVIPRIVTSALKRSSLFSVGILIQGGRAGEYFINEAATAHHPVALDGEDCIMIAFAHGRIELLKDTETR